MGKYSLTIRTQNLHTVSQKVEEKNHKKRQLIVKGRHSGNKLREVAPTRNTDQKREEILRKLIKRSREEGTVDDRENAAG